MNISAHLPSSMLPMSSRPRSFALPTVAILSMSYPVGAAAPEFSLCSRYATRISSSRLLPSLLALPSTPRPTVTPSFSISGMRAMPLDSFILDMGQWATPVPVSASAFNSSELKCMPWAYHTSLPTQPSDSIYA